MLGLVMFPHGAQKMLGWFGGYGFTGTMNFFTGTMHIPAAFAFLAILAEFAGALGLIVGLFSRVAAFGIATVMVVAVLTTTAANGFFMNWFGNQKGEGFEYHLLAIGLSLILLINGGGKASLDAMIQPSSDAKPRSTNEQRTAMNSSESFMPIAPGVMIGHVHLKVPDLKRALAFYRDVLGFQLTQRYGRNAAFVFGGVYHYQRFLDGLENAAELIALAKQLGEQAEG